jgi:hypothetical protein
VPTRSEVSGSDGPRHSARHALWRLETMALMSDVDLPVAHVRPEVASAIDLVGTLHGCLMAAAGVDVGAGTDGFKDQIGDH